jgi:hypothetical protein
MKLEVSNPFESLPNHYHPIIQRHIARVPDIFVSTLLLPLPLLRLQQPIYYRQIIIIIMPVPVTVRSKAWGLAAPRLLGFRVRILSEA